ncbi:zinc ribbon domain-containing protein [Paenibacillus fonticola]|uniref:zinc-ribbon domain-containing protein n=1 Tax=Paenibacillus fonticola TaxID=379896 RepID=UPI0009FC46DD
MDGLDYKFCSSCGRRLNASARFCEHCGMNLVPQAAEQVPSQAPPPPPRVPASGPPPVPRMPSSVPSYMSPPPPYGTHSVIEEALF